MSIQQHNPPHPGALIDRTFIKPFKEVAAAAVAREFGVSKKHLQPLVSREI